MLDLNEAIGNWRAGLSEQEGCRATDIDEMEGHLRDEVEQLRATNLSEEEAWLVAAHRLGDSAWVAREFAKVNEGAVWRNRLFWMGVALLAYFLTDYLARAASLACVTLAALGGLEGLGLSVVSVTAKLLTFGAALFLLAPGLLRGGYGMRFYGATARPWGRILLVGAIVALFWAAGFVCVYITPLLAVRAVGLQKYAQMSGSAAYAALVWSALLPLVVAGLVIYLHPTRWEEAGE